MSTAQPFGVGAHYPAHCAMALVIGTSWSHCGACGKGAYPGQKMHVDVAGWNPEPGAGCGIEWTRVTSSYVGENVEAAVRAMRPDLEWVEMFPGASEKMA